MVNNFMAALLSWTPYLLGGLGWNVLITVMAVLLGTCVGAVFAWIRISKDGGVLGLIARETAKVFRNVPTLAFLFFVVFVFPREFAIPGTDWVVTIPLWVKAIVGMCASVIGFTSESLVVAYHDWKRSDYEASLLFVSTWSNSVTISFLASSTISLIGVGELISRTNTVISVVGTWVMIPMYIYAGMYFVLVSLLWAMIVKRIRRARWLTELPGRLKTRMEERSLHLKNSMPNESRDLQA